MENDWWVLMPNGEASGPIPPATLKRWADKGAIKPDSQVRRNNSRWTPARQVKGLFKEEATPTDRIGDDEVLAILGTPKNAESRVKDLPPHPPICETNSVSTWDAPALMPTSPPQPAMSLPSQPIEDSAFGFAEGKPLNLDCPICGSNQTQRVAVIYEAGTFRSESKGNRWGAHFCARRAKLSSCRPLPQRRRSRSINPRWR